MGLDAARAFGPRKLVADSYQELRKTVHVWLEGDFADWHTTICANVGVARKVDQAPCSDASVKSSDIRKS